MMHLRRGRGKRRRRMLGHDAGILLRPLLLQLGQLRLPDHGIEPRAELARHRTRLAEPFAHEAHRLGQILGPDHEQRHNGDDHEFGRVEIKHRSNRQKRPPAP